MLVETLQVLIRSTGIVWTMVSSAEGWPGYGHARGVQGSVKSMICEGSGAIKAGPSSGHAGNGSGAARGRSTHV